MPLSCTFQPINTRPSLTHSITPSVFAKVYQEGLPAPSAPPALLSTTVLKRHALVSSNLLPKPLKTIKTICFPSPSAQSKCDGFESPILSTAKVSESKDHVASQADIRYFVVDTLLEGTKANLPKRLLPGFSPVSLFR